MSPNPPDFIKIGSKQYRAFYSPSTDTAASVVFGGIDGSNSSCAATATGTLATPAP